MTRHSKRFFYAQKPEWWPENESWPPEHDHSRYYSRFYKPKWWPEGETWPPESGYWHKNRNRFFKRIGFLLVFFIISLVVSITLLGSLLAKVLGVITLPAEMNGQVIPVIIGVFIFSVWALSKAGNSLRRLSAPVGDLMEATERIAAGDYSARVSAQGPAEVRSLARTFNEMAARLQMTSEERRNLMADVTHELRTPLTVIQGEVEGMLDGVYEPSEERLKSILEETRVLNRLVDDLRTLALAESGALQLKREAVDLLELIYETTAVFRSQAESAGVSLDVQMKGELPLLKLDANRMRQVIGNLVANALHYTPPDGTVTVRCELSSTGGEQKALFSVSDTGRGISPEDLAHVFDRFYKARDSSGMGLGLAIARRLVEAHGGTITAESQLGRGTTMRVTLPVQSFAR
jgi:two-component system sensor histidine kinase BaeS